jgi:hypothetical protein
MAIRACRIIRYIISPFSPDYRATSFPTAFHAPLAVTIGNIEG